MPPDYAADRTETRIRTLRDMVLWLNWVRQHQPSRIGVDHRVKRLQ